MDVVNIAYLGSDGQYQEYIPSDKSLINTAYITPSFGNSRDYVEYFIKDLSNTVIGSNYYDTKYEIGKDVDPITGTTSKLLLDPERDVRDAGYSRGSTNIKYNFFRKHLLTTPDPSQNFWIKEISKSRTEIKVARQDLSNIQLADAFNTFNGELSADNYYPDFLLNFGLDQQIIGINALFIEEGSEAYILFKLYEPLPSQFDLKSTFWVVIAVADPVEFSVSINAEPEVLQDSSRIKGPNYKVAIKDSVAQTTPYYNYTSLFSTSISSSYQQLKSMMDEKGIRINVDYGSFSNFVHFSSATDRVENFVYKLQLIESSSAGLLATNTTTAKALLQSTVDNLITKFDGYEYYLYFTSASTAWPKRTSSAPYTLYSVTSSQAQTWLGSVDTTPTTSSLSILYSASYYDVANVDLLQYATPSYILDDSENQPYLTFLNMIGQHFDNIWIYLKDVTTRYSSENNPFVGISMDEVSDALKNFGIDLYTNTSISDNIYTSLLGITANGSLLPPTGSEVIHNYITSSIPTLPTAQIRDEVYKRLYHNLAFLLKAKGTQRGVKALITTYGIPSDAMDTHEFGGYTVGTVTGLQEINASKISTGSVLELSSSLLSPNVTLQYYQNNRDKSSIDIEAGFSPADSINANITSSGYFNLMQYMGDPALQYSSSYTPLDTYSSAYFKANYTKRYNVWDFIRTVKYYNNSLFKMLHDFVPARSSTTTGLIIKSHILERNKYARHEPTITTSSYQFEITGAFISASDGMQMGGTTGYVMAIPINYHYTSSRSLTGSIGTVYMSSSNDVQKYTGEFSGSQIRVHQSDFSQNETSVYKTAWTSSVGGAVKMFTTYSLSSVYQNVLDSVISQKFLDLDYSTNPIKPVNYGLITQSISQSIRIGSVSQSAQPYSQYAQIQDFNYYSTPSIKARYSGSFLVGKYYNTHSAGDISYGNDPVIDYYTSKLGLFTQIATSSFLPGIVNATLGYLADASGGLFELNQNNKHWQDVQNIFKAGDTLTIKQFDNKKYTNQKNTDGIKTIYNSGYSYSPELYFISQSDNSLYFNYVGATGTNGFSAYNSGTPNNYINGAATPTYTPTITGAPTRTGYIYNIFDSFTGAGYVIGNAGTTTFPTFTSTQKGGFTFTDTFNINFSLQDPTTIGGTLNSGSYSFGAYLNGTSPANLIGSVQNLPFTTSYTPAGTANGIAYVAGATPTSYSLTTLIGTKAGPINVYSATGVFLGAYGTSADTITVWLVTGTVGGSSYVGHYITANSSGFSTMIGSYGRHYKPSIQGSTSTAASSVYSTTLSFSNTTPTIALNPGDTVKFILKQEGVSTSNYTASVSIGPVNSILTINTVAGGGGGYPSATTSSGYFISGASTVGNTSTLVLSSNLSQYLGYQFVPYFVSGSTIYSSSLYNAYGDINYTFSPQYGDKVLLGDSNGIIQTVDVLSASLDSSSRLNITVQPPIASNWVNNSTLIYKFLLLRRYNDEQNVHLSFIKTPGQTSYGFAIPITVNPILMANINSVQAAVQSQLLSNQSNTG